MTARAEIREATLVHEFLPEMGLHAFTSPQIKGLFVTSETLNGARTELMMALDGLFSDRNLPWPKLTFTEKAPELQAA